MVHANAPLTPVGRLRLAQLIVDEGWPIRRAAERCQVSPATASKWARRYRAGEDLGDRSSRPLHSPNRIPQRTERRIIQIRFTRRWGPHRIGYHLNIPRSTVSRVLTRYQMPLLAHLDRATGLPIRRPPIHRYQASSPGGLIHIDIKKLGKIPDGGGRRAYGPGTRQYKATAVARKKAARNGGRSSRGYSYLHHAVDSYSRLVYSEQLDDERKETAAAFWQRAHTYFTSAGITVQAIMTDNGACYRSHAFAAALGPTIIHKRTRPYRPQTNGKVERFNRTLTDEWAYTTLYTSNEQRSTAYQDWIHYYNHHRPHTGIEGQTPANRVHNLPKNYS